MKTYNEHTMFKVPSECYIGLKCNSENIIGDYVIVCPECNYAMCYNTFRDRKHLRKFPDWCPLEDVEK